MSDRFIHPDFMLQSETARELYHSHAEGMPIIDYHCHLPPAEVARDQRWETLTQVWLYGDHYKWRQMRTNGVAERFCTGDADDWEKFEKWAETVPRLLGNPLYHWTHLELARYFDVHDLLGPSTARAVYQHCNDKLAEPQMSARGLMTASKVLLVCTTDDPVDALEDHRSVAEDKTFGIQMLPTWRPDKSLAVHTPEAFNSWIARLETAAGIEIGDTFSDLLAALRSRHDAFHAMGCRLSDRGLLTVDAEDYTEAAVSAAFRKARAGTTPDAKECARFRSALLHELAVMDAEKGWTMQIHYGALRNNNRRLFATLGPDIGCDSIADVSVAEPLSRFLGRLDASDRLPKTILYNLNPRDNALLTTMAGNFQDGSVPGKIQHGSAWWFLDHKDGMERQMATLAATGLLSRFVGMLTDSRSFLSYTRHEYFRRILCNLLGNEIEQGLIPRDMELVGEMVKDISYRNAARYFGFNVEGLTG